MTSRFNLLPDRYTERIAERRRIGLTASALVALLAVLAVDGLVQGRALGRAGARRAAEQARTDELQARRRELQPFRQIVDGISGRERLLTAAMGTEVSWAVVLTSLSQAFPADASLTSLSAESTLPPFGAVPGVAPGNDGTVIGSTVMKGYSVKRFTPGVEGILQLLSGVTGLSEPRLQLGADDKIGAVPVTTFEGMTFVDGMALTGRYAEGLPPEDDVELPAIGGTAAGVAKPAAPAAAQR